MRSDYYRAEIRVETQDESRVANILVNICYAARQKAMKVSRNVRGSIFGLSFE